MNVELEKDPLLPADLFDAERYRYVNQKEWVIELKGRR